MTQSSPAETAPLHGRRVLLVEDNEAASRGLARLLQAQGFEVTAVRDGASALAAFASGAPPDFLLTDLQLPDFDGREVARQARRLVPPPRVALITGWDIEPDHGDPDASGIEWFLAKPVDFQDLVAKLNQPAPPKRPM